MGLKPIWKLIFTTDDQQTELMEKKLELLEQQIQSLQALIKNGQEPIKIEKLNIEHLVIDKYETSNNFGSVGIKELSGRLNIGANYSSDGTWKSDKKPEKKGSKETAEKKPQAEQREDQPPHVNIRSRDRK